MKTLESLSLLLLASVLATFTAFFFVGCHGSAEAGANATVASIQEEMDTYCTAKMNAGQLSKLSADDKKGLTYQSFFGRKLHTCIQIFVTLDPKDARAMNYVLSDLTYGFIAPPKWHPFEMPLHVRQTTYGREHHISVEGYWAPVGSDPGQESAADANTVTLTCDYGDRGSIEQANECIETEGYVQFGSIHTNTQTYHVASWNPDEVIATDSELGIFGSTTTTLLIHPQANEVEIIDRTKMDEKQPKAMKELEGKSYGDHFELDGGSYALGTLAVLFQCDEDGIVTDLRLDIAQKYNGDLHGVPDTVWNRGTKATTKFTAEQCKTAMQHKIEEFRGAGNIEREVRAKPADQQY